MGGVYSTSREVVEETRRPSIIHKFTTLDLARGYYQCAFYARDVPKTAFRVGSSGLYEFTRMQMGLCNAPATFSRLMDHVLGEDNFHSLLNYLDDVPAFGNSVDEMIELLDSVFGKLLRFWTQDKATEM